jgi:hypothetical protein
MPLQSSLLAVIRLKWRLFAKAPVLYTSSHALSGTHAGSGRALDTQAMLRDDHLASGKSGSCSRLEAKMEPAKKKS